MAKSKVQKAEILSGLEAKLGKSKSVVFAKFSALKASESRELKRKLKAEQSECYIAKKTLLNKALNNAGISGFDTKTVDGQMVVILGYGDEATPAKITSEFISTSEKRMEFTGGVLEGRILSKSEVEALAKLPSKQELLARLVGTLNAPVSGFVNVLAGVPRGFVRTLSAIGEKKA